MLMESFIGRELMRLREEGFEIEAAARRRKEILYEPEPSPNSGLRQRVGNALIRTGSRLAGVRVEPCLKPRRGSTSLHA